MHSPTVVSILNLIDGLKSITNEIAESVVTIQPREPVAATGIDLEPIARHFEMEADAARVIARTLATLSCADALNDAAARFVSGAARSDRDLRDALKRYFDARVGLTVAEQAATQQDGRL